MKKYFIAALATAVAVTASTAQAQSNIATQNVAFEVSAISSIAVVGTPSLTIVAAPAGSAPTSVTATASYSISTNELNRKVTAELDQDMPAGLTLAVVFIAPNGAASSSKNLAFASQDVITGISTLNEAGLGLTYTLSATSAAGVVAAGSRTVTYTITAGT